MQSVVDCFCDCLVSCKVISTPLFPPLTDTGDILVSHQSHDTNFQLPLDYDSSFFLPLLILPPLLQHRTVVTSPIAFAVDQLALKYLLITPLAQPPFLRCSQMGQLSFYEWAVATHQCFFFLVLLLRVPFHKTPTESSALLRKSVAFCERSQLCSVSCFPKPIWSAVEPRCRQPLRQVKYFEVVLRLRGPWCGWNYGRVVGQWSGVQGASSGRDADNYIQRRVGCFHCHALSLMETKCSPRWSLNLSCWVMCLGQMVIGLIFPHTVVGFFPPSNIWAPLKLKWFSLFGSAAKDPYF